MEHRRDSDCQGHIDPKTDSCKVCGVYHGEPCPDCGGRGYHNEGCPSSDSDEQQKINPASNPSGARRACPFCEGYVRVPIECAALNCYGCAVMNSYMRRKEALHV